MEALTVSEVNARVKALIDGDGTLSRVLVLGELSAYKIYPSGHHYFTMKDDSGVLRCVMFRSDAAGIGFRPSDGIRVIASGSVTVYPRDGQYQLYCRKLIPDGEGSLSAAFEELKRRLESEGLFDVRHKKALPEMPGRIVLVTSPAGAAVRDMIRILGRRWPLAGVVLIPVRVQGDEAPGEIAAAIRYANKNALGDIIITGRGGGSPEDLWAFNDERVARAIFASCIPVISAVGHEPDVTIADFVADARAATPSHAAEIAVPDCEDWQKYLAGLRSRLTSMADAMLRLRAARLEPFIKATANPGFWLAGRRQSVDRLHDRLLHGWRTAVTPHRLRIADKAGRLEALSPKNVLKRGYAVALGEDGKALRRAEDARPGSAVSVILYSGRFDARVEGNTGEAGAEL